VQVRSDVDGKSNVDTFDIAALGVNVYRGLKSSSTFRACLCALLQVVAPGLLLLQMVGTHDKLGHSLCPYDENWEEWYTKLVSKGLGVCLLLYTYNSVMTQQYRWQDKVAHRLMCHDVAFECCEQPTFACLGMVSNGFAMVWASVGAVVLTFLAQAPIDIVLNSLALFFLVEVDNAIVDDVDFRDAKAVLDESAARDGAAPRLRRSPINGKVVMRVQTAIRISRYIVGFLGPAWISICK